MAFGSRRFTPVHTPAFARTRSGTGKPPPQRVTVHLYGDSTMRGAEAADSPFRIAALLQADFDARYGAGQTTVVNNAAGGTKIFDLMAGTAGVPRWPSGLSGQLAVCCYGINEASQADSIAAFQAALRTFANFPGALLQTCLQMDTAVQGNGTASTTAYAQAIRAVAAERKVPLIDTHAYQIGLADWRTRLRDGVHPTDAFYADLVREVSAPAIAARVALLRAI